LVTCPFGLTPRFRPRTRCLNR